MPNLTEFQLGLVSPWQSNARYATHPYQQRTLHFYRTCSHNDSKLFTTLQLPHVSNCNWRQYKSLLEAHSNQVSFEPLKLRRSVTCSPTGGITLQSLVLLHISRSTTGQQPYPCKTSTGGHLFHSSHNLTPPLVASGAKKTVQHSLALPSQTSQDKDTHSLPSPLSAGSQKLVT